MLSVFFAMDHILYVFIEIFSTDSLAGFVVKFTEEIYLKLSTNGRLIKDTGEVILS